MVRAAGVAIPCADCEDRRRFCRHQAEILRQVFFAIGNGRAVACDEYREERYHGIEGVRA